MTDQPRATHLHVRLTREELSKVHALATDRDVTASTVVRHLLRDAYLARFGEKKPKGRRIAKSL